MKHAVLLLMALVLGACTVLPHGVTRVKSKWSSFDQAMKAYEQVKPYSTQMDQLSELGFAPGSQPNVRILHRAEIVERLIKVPENFRENLPKGLCDCLEKGDACIAYELKIRSTNKKRYGNPIVDLLNFKRKVETSGWEFNSVIVLIDDQVVYKAWSGTPDIQEYSDTTNPLGPLQGIGSSLPRAF